MADSGLNATDIAAELGADPIRVARILKDHGYRWNGSSHLFGEWIKDDSPKD